MKKCYDIEKIVRDITHPDVVNNIFGDEIKVKEAVNLLESLDKKDYIYFPYKGGGVVFFRETPIEYSIHVHFPKKKRGKQVYHFVKRTIKEVFGTTFCMCINARIPEFNKGALHMAYYLGFKKIGYDDDIFLKDGESHRQVLLVKEIFDGSC